MAQDLRFHPLTPARWPDLERLFGPERGANSGCWCMWWRMPRSAWQALGKAGRKAAFRGIVEEGAVPGILAYAGDEPVGWCAIEPRERYPVLERSRVARRVDDAPVWSITCFYIAPRWRRAGLMAALIEAAARHAATAGATLVEAYPRETDKRLIYGDAYTGIASTFRACGFSEVARHAPTRPVMRRPVARGKPG